MCSRIAFALLSIFGFANLEVARAECLNHEEFLRWTGGYLPSHPPKPLIYTVTDVAVVGSTAVVAGADWRAMIFDVADPAPPHLRSVVGTDPVWSVAAVATRACLAEYSGLEVFDISVPSTPFALAHFHDGNVSDVQISANFAFTVDGYEALRTYRILPETPASGGILNIPASPRLLTLHDKYAYVGTSQGIQIVDVGNALVPTLVGSIPGNDVIALATDSGRLYVADQSVVRIYGLANPVSPSLLSSVSTLWTSAIIAKESTVLICDGNGFDLYDFSDPVDPVNVAEYGAYTGVSQGVVVGNRAFLAENYLGFQIVDLANHLSASEVAVDSSQPLGDLEEYQGLLYGVRNSELRVYGVGDPLHPNLIRTVPAGSYIEDLTIVGTHAYAAGNDLKIFDLADPTSPALVGSIDLPGSSDAIVVDGDWAYRVNYWYLYAIDVSDPSNPILVSQTEHYVNLPVAIAKSGNFVYIGGQGFEVGGEFWVLDVSDPAMPHYESFVWTDAPVEDIVLQGNRGYMATRNGVEEYDISNPASPYLLGNRGPGDGCRDIDILGGQLYSTSDSRSLHAYAIDSNLNFLGTAVESGYGYGAKAVEILGDFVYVADEAGLHVFERQCPAAVSVDPGALGPEASNLTPGLRISPNPFTRAVAFHLTPSTSPTEITLHDALGRLVRSIAPASPAEEEILWDGRDSSGRDVPAGVYLARARTGSRTWQEQIVRVR